MLATKPRDRKREDLIATVTEYLDKIEEEVIVMDCHNCLSLVPFSKVSIMNSFVLYTPTVQASVMRVRNESLECEDSVSSSSEQFTLLEPLLIPLPKKKRGRKRKILSPPDPETLINIEPSAPKKRGRKRKLPVDESVKDKIDITVISPMQEPYPLDIKNIKQERPTIDYSNFFDEKCEKKAVIRPKDNDEEFKLPAANESDYKIKDYRIFGRSLTPEQNSLLKSQMQKSKINAHFFKCCHCRKALSCYASIQYHIFFKHILPRDTEKEWISRKVLESRKIIKTKGASSSQTVWVCVECSKKHLSAPSIRYHLKSHLKDALDGGEVTNNNKQELKSE